MKPYYEDGDITLYCGDCREVLPRLDPDSVDLLLTDPPYGVEWQSNRRTEAFDRIAGDDGSLDVAEVLRMALLVLRRSRHLYVFGWTSLQGVSPGIGGETELIWDKGCMQMGDLTQPWALTHERIAFATNARSPINARKGEGRLAARLRRGSVLHYDRPNAAAVTRHPTEKPVDLLRELIESSSLFGEVVLDPFAGSGSTLVAARLEGRRAIGVEIEERYCEVAAARLAQQRLPLEVA